MNLDLSERINLHVKGHNVFLVQRDQTYCEIVDGTRGKTIALELTVDNLCEILENLHTYVLDEEIEIDYFVDKNIDFRNLFPTIDFDICCVCYSTTVNEFECHHTICMLCQAKISKCPLCRRAV
uniref:RING-type domain-containing protein n=1 Tax=viral metagenome TaxID=1070528 RepID=A0A6C0HT15_9ZZZZ